MSDIAIEDFKEDEGEAVDPLGAASRVLNEAIQKIEAMGFHVSARPLVEDMTGTGKLIVGSQIMLVPKQ